MLNGSNSQYPGDWFRGILEKGKVTMTVHLEDKPFTLTVSMMIDSCMDDVGALSNILDNIERDRLNGVKVEYDSLVDPIIDRMVEIKNAAENLEIDLEQAESRLSRSEVINELHTSRDHRGFFLTCDACCDDADLFERIMVGEGQ